MRKAVISLVSTGIVVALSAACSASDRPSTAPATTSTAPATNVSGSFTAYQQGQATVTYDQELVPAGASVIVHTTESGAETRVVVSVKGLRPNYAYGAHVHTKPCGASGNDAGPHYQNLADPVQPSVDPKYANPQNEVWLDFTTDAEGGAESRVTENWDFRKGGANSVVIHEKQTMTDAGHAGTAGARLACVTVGF